MSDSPALDRLRRVAQHGVLGVRRRRAARRLARFGTPEATRALAEVLVGTADATVTEVAQTALRQVRDRPRIDAAWDVLFAADHGILGTLVREHDWAPSEPVRRAEALFLFGDYDDYAGLDFDGSLLSAAYTAADDVLRSRLAAHARDTGRARRLNSILHRRALAGDRLGAVEWHSLLSGFVRAERFEDLWRLALLAPPAWSARLFRRLDEHGWRPADGEAGALADELYPRARAALAPSGTAFTPLCHLPRTGEAQVCDVAVDPAGTLLATADRLGGVRLWRLPSGEPGPVLRPAATPVGDWKRQATRCLAITPDGGLLAAGGGDGSIRLWRLPSGEPAGEVRGGAPSTEVNRLAVTPDGSLLISAEYHDYGESAVWPVRMWRLPSGEPAGELRGGGYFVDRLVATSDVVIGLCDGAGVYHPRQWIAAYRWRLSGERQSNLRLGKNIQGVAVGPDGGPLFTDALEGAVRWRLLPGDEPGGTLTLADEPADGYGLRFPPDTGTAPRHPTRDPLIAGHTRTLAVSPDGRLLARVGRAGVGLWLLPTGEPVGWLSWPDGNWHETRQIAFACDGQVLLGNGHGTTVVWRLSCGEVVGRFDADMSWLGDTPTGTLVISRDTGGPGLSLRRYATWQVSGLAATPVPDIDPAEVTALPRTYDDHGEAALAALATTLVRHHHAHDIDLAGDSGSPPARCDVEVSG